MFHSHMWASELNYVTRLVIGQYFGQLAEWTNQRPGHILRTVGCGVHGVEGAGGVLSTTCAAAGGAAHRASGVPAHNSGGDARSCGCGCSTSAIDTTKGCVTDASKVRSGGHSTNGARAQSIWHTVLVTSRIIFLGNAERTQTSVEVITAGATLNIGLCLGIPTKIERRHPSVHTSGTCGKCGAGSCGCSLIVVASAFQSTATSSIARTALPA